MPALCIIYPANYRQLFSDELSLYKTCKKTFVEQARETIPGFTALLQRFQIKLTVSGKANSTRVNYTRCLAQISLHYNSIPTAISIEQVESYLYFIKQKNNAPSETFFKITIVALRCLFKMEGLDELRLKMPSIKREKKLPVVLSKQEMVVLLNKPRLLKHRMLIALLYGCGLRCSEVKNLKFGDIDFHRSTLHVRQSKGKKDRYLPLGNFLSITLKAFVDISRPKIFLFGGSSSKKNERAFDKHISSRGIQWAIKDAAKKAGIYKAINVHTLRHTFATHLMEDGLDIMSIKELLGHSHISTTLIYLHVAQPVNRMRFSPIDNLKGVKIIQGVQYKIEFQSEE